MKLISARSENASHGVIRSNHKKMDKKTIQNRIEDLRAVMETNGIDAYLIPSDDDHASEYVNDHFKFREWITGFTGSAGTALITESNAWLWTDGRYFLQAEDELKGTGVTLLKMGEPDVPSIKDKISELVEESNASDDSSDKTYTLGFSGDTITSSEGEALAESCGAMISYDKDLAAEVWHDRPALEPSEIWELPLTSCGMTMDEKLSAVRNKMALKGAEILLISDLMESAWLLDLRGSDIQNTPVFYSYIIVADDECYLFTLPGALTSEMKTLLESSGITCRGYTEVSDILCSLLTEDTLLWADKTKTSYALIKNACRCGCRILNEATPVEMMKAVKNAAEIKATDNAHLKDGIAVTKFIYWLKHTIGKEDLTELKCCDKLEQLRRSQDGLFDLSFPTIAGYNDNGAIIHYEPTPETDAVLKPEGFLLVDSGGQYTDGTTDITRTIALGPLSDKMRRYYTLVLKAHITLGSSIFKCGTTGFDLDRKTRKVLQDNGLDYNHGTGHGVGHVSSVHEGPNYISKHNSDTAFRPGMITSNEPGVYIEGEFGIRLESEILCEKAGADDMLKFNTLTRAPFDREAIIKEMLTDEEKSWLNAYHEYVKAELTPFLEGDEADWLAEQTAPL